MWGFPITCANCAIAFGVCGLGLLASAAAADFTGSGTGAIPDNDVSGLNVSFAVSGITAPVTKVSLKLGLVHTWVGDLKATLISPGGVARLIVFSQTGASRTTFTDSSNLSGVYEFTDDADKDWYALAAALDGNTALPPGRYRTTTAGVPSSSAPVATGTNHGGCSTSLKGAFKDLPAVNANGSWTLSIADLSSMDTGSVTSAVLSVSDDNLFSNGFEPVVRGGCKLALSDYTGTGRTSFALARPVGSDVQWLVKNNDGTLTGAIDTFTFGLSATDFIIDGDFDGDGITDPVVWREAAAGVAKFIVRRSSRPSQPLEIVFGQTGDDPAEIGDYDGDGIADVAVFRQVEGGSNPAHTLIRPSGGGPDRNLLTGEDGGFAIGGFDYTGDGVADIAIQSSNGGGVARFRIYDGKTGSIVRDFTQGMDNDFIVPGNVVGNSIYDLTTRRTVGGNREHTTRDMSTLVVQPLVVWGVTGDFSLSGDFDGDGLDDYGVWRASMTPGASQFVIRQSSDLSTLTLPMGQNMDVPPASERVH